MGRFRIAFRIYLITVCAGLGLATWLSSGPEYAYSPPDRKLLNPGSGSSVQAASSGGEQTPDIELGRETFAAATFGNEVYFTDILGGFDGPLTLPAIGRAVAALRGRGTTNLQVRAAQTAKIGDLTIRKGDIIDTGMDVPKGAYMPLGVNVSVKDGKARAGVTCLLCHATVDDRTGKVAMGMPNTDLNVGLMLAMGTNTASYFTHTDIQDLQTYMKDLTRTVTASDGSEKVLPDPDLLEDAVDRSIMKWPKGGNDTTIDLRSNPVQIPDSITRGKHPYGWSGQGITGPFRGLTAAINNAHAQNMDPLSQSELSGPVMQIDKEVYLGTMLQRAANPRFRYDPSSGRKPSEFFAGVDPTPGVPGVNRLIPAPGYPRSSYMSAVGLFNSDPGYGAWEQARAMSGWMNALVHPKPRYEAEERVTREGAAVFQRAGCARCHAGEFLTNNRVLPAGEVGTEPSRALGFQPVERFFEETPRMYTPGTPVPLPADPPAESLALTEEERAMLRLAWGREGSQGGYKVPSLLGLSWTAPYLHDGGVAVGPDAGRDLGIPGTWQKGVSPDPLNSLKAMLDRKLRSRVLEANKADAALQTLHVTGEGHPFWVDEETGFTKEEQGALVRYLLTIQGP